MKDYITGSYIKIDANFTDVETKEQIKIDERLVKLSKSYEEVFSLKFECKEHTGMNDKSSTSFTLHLLNYYCISKSTA